MVEMFDASEVLAFKHQLLSDGAFNGKSNKALQTEGLHNLSNVGLPYLLFLTTVNDTINIPIE